MSASAQRSGQREEIQCPRCGHELRGVVDSWIEACPVTGVCAECGVDFEWRHVAGSDRMPRWFVECLRRRWFSGTRTFVRSLMPWRFWRSIRMTMPVRASLLTYPLRFAALLIVMGTIATGVRVFATAPARLTSDPEAVSAAIVLCVIAPFLGEPVENFMDRWKTNWSTSSPNQPAPGFGWGWSRAGRVVPRGASATTWSAARPALQTTLVALAGSAIAFIALPIVRKRAKVRWSHLHRAAICGLGIALVVPVVGWTIDGMWLANLPRVARGQFIAPTYEVRSMPSELALVPLLLALWWWSVSRWYLRLERPLAVALSVSIMGTLGSAALSYLLDEDPIVHGLMRISGI